MSRGFAVLPACTLVLAGACNTEFRFEDTTSDGATPGALTCEADPDCGHEALHCATEVEQCVECFERSHCTRPGLNRCHIFTHRCVECGGPRDCGMGWICERRSNRCIPLCRDPNDCPGEFAGCDAVRGFCVECLISADCNDAPGGTVCDRPAGRCVECVDDGGCDAAKPRCDPLGGRCVACLDSADCAAPSPVCDPVELVCKPRA